MLKSHFVKASAILMAGSLSACAGVATDQAGDNTDSQKKCLVLYYSQTGTTKAVAEQLQKTLGADIEAIEAENPYDGSYDETIQRVAAERAQGVTPQIKFLSHRPKDYDVVFLGYPVWFGTYAPPVASLLAAEDFEGVKVVPFCTFGSGGLEATRDELVAALPNATVAEGYGVRTARIDSMPAELSRFLIEGGYICGDITPLPDFSVQRAVTPAQANIFTEATADYMFPLGTPVTCGYRHVGDDTEYMFVARSTSPSGEEAYTSVLVLSPAGENAKPVFTRVVR